MNHGRLKLIIIFAAFLGPLLAAFVWYYALGAAFSERATSNHAPLITPPIALGGFSNPQVAGVNNVDGAAFGLASLKRRWSVIHRLALDCPRRCEKSLYNTRQTRLALGKDSDRIQRIFISPSRALLNRLAAAHPDSTGLLESAGGIEKQLAPIIQRRAMGPADAMLIDPLGNLMLIIPADLDPRLLLKDLKRLLKLSRIG